MRATRDIYWFLNSTIIVYNKQNSIRLRNLFMKLFEYNLNAS